MSLITDAAGELPDPAELEAAALRRIGAPPTCVSACQLRPDVDLGCTPLLRESGDDDTITLAGEDFGEEREVTILFMLIFAVLTSLAETRLPDDVVFVKLFVRCVSRGSRELRGILFQLYGRRFDGPLRIGCKKRVGAKAALRCALSMFERLDSLNQRLVGELETPLEIGIGIHTGQAIVGRMGPPKTPIISAVGDSVNTAARFGKDDQGTGRAASCVSRRHSGRPGWNTSAGLTQVSFTRTHRNNACKSRLDKASLREILV